MSMTVNELIVELQRLNPELREKKVVIQCPNGLLTSPVPKQMLIDKYNVFGGYENVESIILTY